VTFFAWTAVCSKILTLDNLERRGMVVVNRCWLCEAEWESVDHLLLHCVVANALWNAFFSPLWGYASLRQGVIHELVDGWPYEERCCLENDPSLYYVVYLEEEKE
jgi:hypothetical protein